MVEINADSMEFSLFAGCTIQNRIPFLEKSARLVFEKMGVSLIDLPEFGCCPDPVGVQSTDQQSWLTLGARNLAISEKKKLSILSLCNGCSETLKAVNQEMQHNLAVNEKVNRRLSKINLKFNGTIGVHHFVEILHDKIGVKKIQSLVIHNFRGIKVAIHPGCHYSRPKDLVYAGEENSLDVKFQKNILRAIGAEVMEYDEESMCCGAGVARHNEEAAAGMLRRKFDSIAQVKPDLLIVNCPACFQRLESAASILRKANVEIEKIPVLYITEILALAFGYSSEELGLKFHMIKPLKFLQSKVFA